MPEPFREKIGITLFLAWLFFLGFVTRVIFAPLMPAIEQDLAISHSQAGGLFLMMSVGYLAAPLCSGFISSKINHRGTLILSAWLIGFVLIPFLFVSSIWPLRLLLAAIGFAAGIHLPSAIATITAQIQKQDWGKALSVHQSAPPLAFVSAPLLATLLLATFASWRMVLGVWAVAAMISALAYTFGGKGGDFPGQLASPDNVKTIVTKPAFWLMVLLFAMAMGGNAGIYAMLPLYLVKERSMELGTANTIIGISQISGLLMVFVGGMITDKVGQKAMMTATLLLSGIFTVLIGVLTGGWLIVAIFIQPAVLNAFFPAAFGALSRIAPPHMRSVTNAIGPPLSFLIGGGILPSVIGYLGETRTFSAGMVLAGVFILIGPFLMPLLKFGQYDNQPGC
jgi:NNP family nitrate/nitrite transporter-like MFS transporter